LPGYDHLVPPVRTRTAGKAGPRPRAGPAAGACKQCAKSGATVSFGPWTFCSGRCRARYLTDRSRKAAAAGKKLKCPLCGKGNPARARRCGHCRKPILWRARGRIATVLVWGFQMWLLASLAGIGYIAYQFRDVAPLLGGGSDPAGAIALLGQPGVKSSEAMLGESLASAGATPQEIRAAVMERARPTSRPPGPGTWLLPGSGMPPILLAEDPAAGTLFPPNFGELGAAARGKAVLGLVTSGKIRPLLRPTRVRVLQAGDAFSQVETLDAPTRVGWALNAQIVSH